MIAIERAVRLPIAPEAAFAFVADYRNTRRFMANLTRFEPLDSRPYGLGSRFAWGAIAMGVRITAEFEVTEFDPPRRMAAKTIHGPRSSCWWEFEAASEGTLGHCHATYRLPNLPLVHAIGGWLIEQELANTLERSLRNLRDLVAPMALPAALAR